MKFAINEWEENRYHDSYGYMTFYDSDTDSIQTEMHWTTASAGHMSGGYHEATGEILERIIELRYRKEKARLIRQAVSAHFNINRPLDKGTKVEIKKPITRGKNKCEVGQAGVVFWSGVDQFGSSRYSDYRAYRFGIEVNGNKIFVGQDNLKLFGNRPTVDWTRLKEIAMANARSFNYDKRSIQVEAIEA